MPAEHSSHAECQHTSAYVSIRQHTLGCPVFCAPVHYFTAPPLLQVAALESLYVLAAARCDAKSSADKASKTTATPNHYVPVQVCV